MYARVRWGILGCGEVTERKSGPAFQKAQASSLVAVMRRSGSLARDYAERHGVPRWYSDVDALLADREVDAVYVATPPGSHARLAIRCARAGKPTYVEKPMACCHAECTEMLQASQQAGVPLFVAYYRRALPRFERVKALLDGGEVGEVRFARVVLHKRPSPAHEGGAAAPWRFVPALSGGGRFIDLGCHTLDLLDYLLGPVVEVHGVAANQGTGWPVEDAVAVALRFESGALGSGQWCFTASEPEDTVQITGTGGSLSFSTFGSDIRVASVGKAPREIQIPNPEHIEQPLIQTIVDELRGVGACPSTGASAARTTAVMDRVLASFRRALTSSGQDSAEESGAS